MKPSRRIPPKVKSDLISEAGEKCANPGCPNTRVEFHHIQQWAVFKSHNQKDMIAICPTCHDAAHHGKLKITEKTLYEWKKIHRDSTLKRTNIFIEPGTITKIILGSLAFQQGRPGKTKILNIANDQHLTFEVEDDFLIVSTEIKNENGETLVKISNNNITSQAREPLKIEQYPGRFKITTTADTLILPAYALVKMRKNEPDYAANDIVTIIDIQTIKPGHVKVEGFWRKDNKTIIATPKSLNFIELHGEPQQMLGEGEDSVLIFMGSINEALFNWV